MELFISQIAYTLYSTKEREAKECTKYRKEVIAMYEMMTQQYIHTTTGSVQQSRFLLYTKKSVRCSRCVTSPRGTYVESSYFLLDTTPNGLGLECSLQLVYSRWSYPPTLYEKQLLRVYGTLQPGTVQKNVKCVRVVCVLKNFNLTLHIQQIIYVLYVAVDTKSNYFPLILIKEIFRVQ